MFCKHQWKIQELLLLSPIMISFLQKGSDSFVSETISDCLIQLDDDRTDAAMKRFSRLSERTQVILFTHHQHLIELAESSLAPSEYHLHRLAD